MTSEQEVRALRERLSKLYPLAAPDHGWAADALELLDRLSASRSPEPRTPAPELPPGEREASQQGSWHCDTCPNYKPKMRCCEENYDARHSAPAAPPGEREAFAIHRICSKCNKDYRLNCGQFFDGRFCRVHNFGNCPHCGERDDPWIEVRSAPAAPSKVGEWQPIESAPGSGGALLWDSQHDSPSVVRLDRYPLREWMQAGFTHWQPLPAPPVALKEPSNGR